MKNSTSTTKLSEKNSAQTPCWFVDSLESYLGRDFTFDVCANKETAKCVGYYSLDEQGDDALKLPWDTINFCNPPFSEITPFIEKAISEAKLGKSTAMIFPAVSETAYSRLAFDHADTIIKMPFRLKFLRPDGTPFLGPNGKIQGPQFACQVAWITPLGLKVPTRTVYHDFRIGYKDKM